MKRKLFFLLVKDQVIFLFQVNKRLIFLIWLIKLLLKENHQDKKRMKVIFLIIYLNKMTKKIKILNFFKFLNSSNSLIDLLRKKLIKNKPKNLDQIYPELKVLIKLIS